jgi:hypothetical protein
MGVRTSNVPRIKKMKINRCAQLCVFFFPTRTRGVVDIVPERFDAKRVHNGPLVVGVADHIDSRHNPGALQIRSRQMRRPAQAAHNKQYDSNTVIESTTLKK